jgi:hypothetical protein
MSTSYPYALERPHDPGSPHVEPPRFLEPAPPAAASSPEVVTPDASPTSTEERTATPAAETAASPETSPLAPERRRRGKGGARKVRKDPALEAELAGVPRPVNPEDVT